MENFDVDLKKWFESIDESYEIVSRVNNQIFTYYLNQKIWPELEAIAKEHGISDQINFKPLHTDNKSHFHSEFEEIKKLGEGGQGIVYKAKNKNDGLYYAVKRIHMPLSKCMQYDFGEILYLVSLEHPNIVRMYSAWVESPETEWQNEPDDDDYDENESSVAQTSDSSTLSNTYSRGMITSQENNSHSMVSNSCQSRTIDDVKKSFSLYIQMELCEEQNLKEWLTSTAIKQPRDYEFILEIFYQIVDAVQLLHFVGVMHRDLKPANIFFGFDGKIRVGDFGLVTEVQKFDPRGYTELHTANVGTVTYMPPEQQESQEYDNKVDIYPLGIILFELLRPMSTDHERGNTIRDLKELKFPSDFCIQYPDEHKLLKKMLDKDPNNRPKASFIKSEVETLLKKAKDPIVSQKTE